MIENMGYRQERLKDIVKNEEEKEEKQQKEEGQQQDYYDEIYDTVAKIKLMYERKRLKEFKVTENLNKSNTKMIMINITSHIEMMTKVIDLFKSVIHQSDE